MFRLDIGCGLAKHLGFTGLDRSPMPGVDVVADLDQALPFANNSVDLLLACHSLEHVSALMQTLKELYRVCKHGAQVCIVAPYANQALCMANPYHLAAFNEHTPRFWTHHKSTRVPRVEFDHPHAPDWGLSRSDNSDPGIDIRLVRMEFFYFPEHLHKSQEELRRLRIESMDVCDQVMYHLLVWKDASPTGEAEFEAYADNLQPFIPDLIARRNKKDSEIIIRRLGESLKSERLALSLQAERVSELERVQLEVVSLRERIGVLERLSTELVPLRAESERWQAEAISLRKREKDQDAVAGLLKAELEQRRAESERWQAEAISLRKREKDQDAVTGLLKAELEQRRAESERWQAEAISLRRREKDQDALTGLLQEEIEQRRAELDALRTDLKDVHREMASLSGERLTDMARAEAKAEELRSKYATATRSLEVLTAEASIGNTMMERFEQMRGAEREWFDALDVNSGEIRSLKEMIECGMERLHTDLAAALASSGAHDKYRARAALLQAELETANAMLSSAAEQHGRLASEIEAATLHAQRVEAGAAGQAAIFASHNRLLQRETANLRLLSPVGLLRFGPYVVGRLQGRSPELGAEQLELIAACSKTVPGAARCLVALSGDIREVPYLEFSMRTPVRGPQLIQLAVYASDCDQSGLVGVELVSSAMRIMAHMVAPLSEGVRTGIVEFAIPAAATLMSDSWFLRVFARDAERCMRIVLLRRGAVGLYQARDFPVALPAAADS